MGYSILMWLAGFAADKIKDSTYKYFTEKTLDDQLVAAVNKWLKEHQYDDTVAEALFTWSTDAPTSDQPARREITALMNASKIPQPSQWLAALKERFVELQQQMPVVSSRQALFQEENVVDLRIYGHLTKIRPVGQ